MRRTFPLLTVMTLALATPAAAGDLLYPGGTLLSEGAIGKPVWEIQAECAGLFGATSNILASNGDTRGADAAKAQGVAFFQDGVERLMRDRGISRAAAIAAASPAVDAGRAGALQSIRSGGFGPRSGWNTARSICLDVADVYRGIRYR